MNDVKRLIKEEFCRNKITEIKEKLLYYISQIEKGIFLKDKIDQTNYMNEIKVFNNDIQNLRKNNIYNDNVKKLEKEWKYIFDLIRRYDIAVKKFNTFA